MTCTSPITVIDKFDKKAHSYPCGQCLACRIKRTSEWKQRLLFELPYWDYNAVFLTLTYDDEHLPEDNGLHKEDLQKFFKRLRKDLVLENRVNISPCGSKSAKLKYFACGEYGDKTLRPHYHAIVFGLNYDSHDRQLIKDNWRYCDPLRFNGTKSGFAPVSPNDIGYVCGYVQKKYNGEKAKEIYGDRLPPFQLQSQGLGLRYALDNADRIRDSGITQNGVSVSVPRYFVKKLGRDTLSGECKLLEQQIGYLLSKGLNTYVKTCLLNTRYDLIEHKYNRMKEEERFQADKNLKAKFNLKGDKL